MMKCVTRGNSVPQNVEFRLVVDGMHQQVSLMPCATMAARFVTPRNGRGAKHLSNRSTTQRDKAV